MTAQRGRPTRPGVSDAARSGDRTGRGTATMERGTPRHPAVPSPRRSGSARRAETLREAAAGDYPIDGATALAVVPDDLGPIRTRPAEERDAADARAAQRAADRAAGRATAESRRRLRVAPPLPVTVAKAPFVAMLLSVVVAGVVGILVLSTLINANQFQLNDLHNKQSGLDQQQQLLQQNLANLQAPGSLVAAAKKLGLVPAGTLAYIRMPDGSVVGVPEPADQSPSVTAQAGPSTESTATTGVTPSGTSHAGAPASGAGH